jgi:hypothetical protein
VKKSSKLSVKHILFQKSSNGFTFTKGQIFNKKSAMAAKIKMAVENENDVKCLVFY